MRIWTFAAQKGGCGKSTLATQLAAYSERCGETVLIIDVDPQGSVAVWQQQRGGNSPMVIEAMPVKLDEILASARAFGVSLVMIDTAPHSDKDAVVAVRLADLIICPAQPSMFDLASLRDTVNVLSLADALSRAVGVVNFVPPQGGKRAYDEARVAMESFGLRVCPSFIGYRRAFPNAVAIGKAVCETEPNGKAAAEITDAWQFFNTLSPIAKTTRKKKASAK